MSATLPPSLIAAAQQGEPDAQAHVLRALEPLIRHLAHRYWSPGWDREDWRQIARVGAWTALTRYRPEAGAFHPFATLVISRTLQKTLRMLRCNVRRSEETVWSLDEPVWSDDADRTSWGDTVPDPRLPPLERALETETVQEWVAACAGAMTPTEWRAFCAHVADRPPAPGLSWSDRSWDNAWQRARRKAQASWQAVTADP